MKRIYSVLVENRAGVLCKVAGLFWRRCFNIDSLAVGETEDHAVSNMTIVSSGDQRTLEQIEKQLNKKLDVIKVRTFEESEGGDRGHVQDPDDHPDVRYPGAGTDLYQYPEVRQHRGDGADRHPGAS